MINISKTIDNLKNQKEVKQSLPKNIFWKLFKKHSHGDYVIDKRNKKVIYTIFKYFIKDNSFNQDNLIKSEASLKKGLLIYGDYGIGKSYLFKILHAIGKDLITNYNFKDLWFNKISAGSFVDMYMQEVTKKEKNSETNFDLKQFYKGKLYIDDLGFEKMAFNKTELFGEILFERNRAGNITYVTTNLIPSEITKRYGERIGDRLPEMFNIIKWEGESFRK